MRVSSKPLQTRGSSWRKLGEVASVKQRISTVDGDRVSCDLIEDYPSQLSFISDPDLFGNHLN